MDGCTTVIFFKMFGFLFKQMSDNFRSDPVMETHRRIVYANFKQIHIDPYQRLETVQSVVFI